MSPALLAAVLLLSPCVRAQTPSGDRAAPDLDGRSAQDLVDRSIALQRKEQVKAKASSLPCEVDIPERPRTDEPIGSRHSTMTASCHYDASGNVSFWVADYRSEVPGSDRVYALTGFPQILGEMKTYLERWGYRDLGTTDRTRFSPSKDVMEAVSSELSVYRHSREPNSANPATAALWRQRLKKISPFLPSDILQNLHCDEFSDSDRIDRVIGEQFSAWKIDGIEFDFPPYSTGRYPGSLSVRTFRIPLYDASDRLASAWSKFWVDCSRTSGTSRVYDGCTMDFSSLLRCSASDEARASSYPSPRLAARAEAIAAAIDAASRFDAVTRELVARVVPRPGIEDDHLEPGDIPPELLDRVETARKNLETALNTIPADSAGLTRAINGFLDSSASRFDANLEAR